MPEPYKRVHKVMYAEIVYYDGNDEEVTRTHIHEAER